MADQIIINYESEISIVDPIHGAEQSIYVDSDTIDIISEGSQGPAGPPLEQISLIEADEDLGGHRIINIFNGKATYASNIDNYNGQLALNMSAVSQGEIFDAYTAGVFEEPSWNFSDGFLFLGTNGLIVDSPPISGSVISIGKVLSNTSLFLQIQYLCKRS